MWTGILVHCEAYDAFEWLVGKHSLFLQRTPWLWKARGLARSASQGSSSAEVAASVGLAVYHCTVLAPAAGELICSLHSVVLCWVWGSSSLTDVEEGPASQELGADWMLLFCFSYVGLLDSTAYFCMEMMSNAFLLCREIENSWSLCSSRCTTTQPSPSSGPLCSPATSGQMRSPKHLAGEWLLTFWERAETTVVSFSLCCPQKTLTQPLTSLSWPTIS